MKRIWGVSLWIWGIGFCLLAVVGLLALPWILEAAKPAPLEMVKKELWRAAGRYEVRGQIFNPRKEPARNVELSFAIWQAKLGHGDDVIRIPAGDAEARIDYLPAGKTVDFTAVSAVRVEESGVFGFDSGPVVESGKP